MGNATTAPADSPTAPVPAHVVTARNAVAVVFGLNGFAIATWFSRIPAARDALDLTAGRLGLLLLALSAGSVLALPTSGAVTQRIGARRAVAGGTLFLCAGLAVAGVGVGVWPSVWAVGAGLFALGWGAGTCEVAMNVEAAAVERQLGRTVMPRFHAAWSVGTVAGAALGAGAVRAGLPATVHLATAAALTCAGTLLAVRAFLPPAAPAGGATPTGSRVLDAWREPRTLLVGLLVLVMAFTEGTANDWLAVAFIDGHGFGEAAGAAVFGVFVAAMTIGRTAGTVALDRWGRVPVLLATMVLAAAGAATAVLADAVPLALAGVALWGLGTSLGFPVGMSAAADDERRAPARVSVVAVIGYSAFLAGPPLVGLLGDRVGTLRALLVVPLLVLPALALVPAARPRASES
ncbi:MAG TPA: MFS transporter [Pilimelia sp.]|nr:MFS transporter [Pilimelia sp.]